MAEAPVPVLRKVPSSALASLRVGSINISTSFIKKSLNVKITRRTQVVQSMKVEPEILEI